MGGERGLHWHGLLWAVCVCVLCVCARARSCAVMIKSRLEYQIDCGIKAPAITTDDNMLGCLMHFLPPLACAPSPPPALPALPLCPCPSYLQTQTPLGPTRCVLVCVCLRVLWCPPPPPLKLAAHG